MNTPEPNRNIEPWRPFLDQRIVLSVEALHELIMALILNEREREAKIVEVLKKGVDAIELRDNFMRSRASKVLDLLGVPEAADVRAAWERDVLGFYGPGSSIAQIARNWIEIAITEGWLKTI